MALSLITTWPLPKLGGMSSCSRLVSDSVKDAHCRYWRGRIVVHDHDVEAACQAGHEFPGLRIAMDAAQDMAVRDRNIVLDEIDRNARVVVDLAVVRLDIVTAKVLEDRGRLDQK